MDGSETLSSATSCKEALSHRTIHCVHHRNKKKTNKLVNSECFFFRLISVYCDTTLLKKNVLTLFIFTATSLRINVKHLCWELRTLDAVKKREKKTLIARLEIEPLLKWICNSFSKGMKKKTSRKNRDRGKCNWIFFEGKLSVCQPWDSKGRGIIIKCFIGGKKKKCFRKHLNLISVTYPSLRMRKTSSVKGSRRQA